MTTRRPLHSAPPYVSFTTFLRFLDWLEEQGMPQRFDRSFWGKRLSGAYGAQMTAAFRFLRLIDRDDCPTDELGALVFSTGQRKSIVRELLRSRYPSIFQLDLSRATGGQLEERFRDLGLHGDTLRKALAFFVHAAQYADIPLSPFISRRSKPRAPVGTTPRHQKTDDTGGSSDEQIHPILLAMLLELSGHGERWSAAEKQRWLTAFSAAVDLLYPAPEEP